MTIHITPEPDFSYVSFETDVPQQAYSGLIMKLIDVFKPGKFMLNILLPSVRVVKSKQNSKSTGTGVGGAGGGNGVEKKTTGTTPPEVTNIHGMKLYEELLSAGGFTPDYRRCDFQMVHYKHMDILYARYVSDAISWKLISIYVDVSSGD